jgi:hypothetical protein
LEVAFYMGMRVGVGRVGGLRHGGSVVQGLTLGAVAEEDFVREPRLSGGQTVCMSTGFVDFG